MRWLQRPPPCGPALQCSQLPVARLFLGLTLLVCIVMVAVTFDPVKIEALLLWVQENKAAGSLLFLALYTAGVVLMLPAMVMAMAAGAIFGLVVGSVVAWVGSSVGQVLAFGIGRYLLRETVLGYLTRTFPKWTAIDRAMVSEGWKMVTLLRLSPIAPWNVLNYVLGVTSVPLGPYTLASCLAILPYIVMFVYFGSLARNLADVFTGNTGLDTHTTIIMGAVSAVFMVAIVWYTTHVSRKAVAEALRTHADELPPELTTDLDVVTLLGGGEVGEDEGAARAVHATVEMTSVGVGPPLAPPAAVAMRSGSGDHSQHLQPQSQQQQPQQQQQQALQQAPPPPPHSRAVSPLSRRTGAHSPLTADGAEGDAVVLLGGRAVARGDEAAARPLLHSRSAQASPRSRSQSPKGADKWQHFP